MNQNKPRRSRSNNHRWRNREKSKGKKQNKPKKVDVLVVPLKESEEILLNFLDKEPKRLDEINASLLYGRNFKIKVEIRNNEENIKHEIAIKRIYEEKKVNELQHIFHEVRIPKTYRSFLDRQYELRRQWAKNYGVKYEDVSIQLKTVERVAIGLGQEHILETGLRLGRNQGVAFLPGTSIKGAVRAFAIQQLALEAMENTRHKYQTVVSFLDKQLSEQESPGVSLSKSEDELMKLVQKLKIKLKSTGNVSFTEIKKIFGSQKHKGEIVFLDAFPEMSDKADSIAKIDVMTPHYQPYYQNGKIPGDWYDPIPINFYTIAENTKFNFTVLPLNENSKELAKKARDLLEMALTTRGIGAKTSIGYGIFASI